MSIVGSDFTDAKREFINDVIDEIDGTDLRMFLVDFKRSDARRIVYGRELEAAYFLSVFAFKRQKLNVHLNMMAWNLLIVSFGVNFA